jgi:hypothetical protein
MTAPNQRQIPRLKTGSFPVSRGSLDAHFAAMQTYTLSHVARQIDQIRDEIRLSGFSVAGPKELDFLCASPKERTAWLKQISAGEGWTFERQPDGKVRLSNLARQR